MSFSSFYNIPRLYTKWRDELIFALNMLEFLESNHFVLSVFRKTEKIGTDLGAEKLGMRDE